MAPGVIRPPSKKNPRIVNALWNGVWPGTRQPQVTSRNPDAVPASSPIPGLISTWSNTPAPGAARRRPYGGINDNAY